MIPQKHVLVFNPNTDKAITETFSPIFSKLNLQNIVFTYWTCPTGPSLVKTQADMFESSRHCLPLLLDLTGDYHGFLGACYADHPIVRLLQSYVGDKPVVGIFDASIHASLQLVQPGSQFGIVTTGAPFEYLLTEGVEQLLSNTSQYNIKHLQKFGGVAASGIGIGDICGESREIAKQKIMVATTTLLNSGQGQVRIICVGGVILLGMENWIREACELTLGPRKAREVKIIEQLAAGALMLEACLHHRTFVDFSPALS